APAVRGLSTALAFKCAYVYIYICAINSPCRPSRSDPVADRGAPAPRGAARGRPGRASRHPPVRRLPSLAHPHRERVRADAPQRPATPVLTAPRAVSGAGRVALPLSTALGVATRPAGIITPNGLHFERHHAGVP